MIPLPGVDIKGNRGGGVIPPPGAKIEVNVVGRDALVLILRGMEVEEALLVLKLRRV